MLGIPRRHSHFVFGAIHSGLTSMIASGIGTFPLLAVGNFFRNWLASWFISWALMLPLVLTSAIRSLSLAFGTFQAAGAVGAPRFETPCGPEKPRRVKRGKTPRLPELNCNG